MNNNAETEKQQAETVEHLLGIVVENREKRCAEVREKAYREAREILKQAHARNRAHMHHHIDALREKYRLRVSSAIARNQTHLRHQHQKDDRAILDVAWPVLRQSMLALWHEPDTRRMWLDASIAAAAARLREYGGRIEHPKDMGEDDMAWIKQQLPHGSGQAPVFSAEDTIEAGIRIIADGTVVDTTLEGLLHHKSAIEATMIARVKQGIAGHE
ncbi:MAG: hypothetical protein WBO73_09650 [Gammaproteobacteria bacterium]|jgi:hypothetical protein